MLRLGKALRNRVLVGGTHLAVVAVLVSSSWVAVLSDARESAGKRQGLALVGSWFAEA